MNGRHAFPRPVIVNDQIVRTQNTVVAFHQIGDLLIEFRIYRFSHQRFQGIAENGNARPHNQYGYQKSGDAVHVNAGKMGDQNGSCGGRSGDHIPKGIRRGGLHHFGIDPFPQSAVIRRHPQFYPYGKYQDQKRQQIKGDILRIA